MLVAQLKGERIDATVAERGPEYNCPHCKGIVILKKGRIVIAHFAHKPPTDCAWAKGETQAHLLSKNIVAGASIAWGLKAEVEFVVETMSGDRRADVMVWAPDGRQIAFELQHTPIDLRDIECRASSYAQANIAQIWIPFLKSSVWSNGQRLKGGWFVERYSPRPFERWVHGFNGKHGMWMYDPAKQEFWLGRMEGHQIYVEETTYFTEGGDENTGGGFYRYSKRYKELTLEGPYKPDQLRIFIKARKAFSTADYSWPAGQVAHLTPLAPEKWSPEVSHYIVIRTLISRKNSMKSM